MYLGTQRLPPVSLCVSVCVFKEEEAHFVTKCQEQGKKKNPLNNSCLAADWTNKEIQDSFPTVVRIIFGGDARAAAPTHC